ncbi:hypothetical protein MBLNU459_g2290t2 [Dothideomycetes sp. NU459]
MSVPAREQTAPMPIAIVGMSCRLPGDVSTLESFWELLSKARSGWSEIPKERFNVDAYHHPNPEKKGCFNPTGGYFLKEDVSRFDAPFFNLTAQEAASLDPQQRILLECTYEALENAGIPKGSVAGKRCGVFVGGSMSDYHLSNLRDLDSVPMFDATGNQQSILSNRISYYFDMRGPSFTVDTACSSSLYALHQAVQSMRSGESDQAIVAACHLNLLPDLFVSMSMSRLFSDEGKTYSFDHRAKSGFARGEGAGCLVLKPLDHAIRDNDLVRAVIVNSGVNQDGRTTGMTNPSGEAQERLMREVYAKAHIDPRDTGFVEAHGTGTKVGDPIETSAIHAVFGESRTARQPLYIGSVKSNVGHLEGASGVVSVIKAALMLEKGFILPNINFEKANEAIPLARWNMKVPVTQRPWPAGKRFVSINNFGFGGANAHVVLEKPSMTSATTALVQVIAATEAAPKLFVLSGNDEESSKQVMKSLGIYLEQHPEVFQKSLSRNLAYTLSQRRSHLSWRVAIAASSTSDLAEGLNNIETTPTRSSRAPTIGFVYTGQGAQWHAMGRQLMETHPVFASTMKAADAYLKAIGADFSLIEELSRDEEASRVGEAHISQPVCTAVQLAVTNLLKSWGVVPAAVTGHSSGEIGAAYGAGILSLESCLSIAYHRGQAIVKLREKFPDLKGAMMAVGASAEDVRPLLKALKNGTAVVACINSPSSITVSGDDAAITELAAAIEQRQQFNRKLRVNVAYHSPHMGLIADDYYAAIRDIKALPDRVATFHSSLLGCRVDENVDNKFGPSYWVDNLTCPVRFAEALQDLCSTDHTTRPQVDVLVEIGPHAALEGPVKQILKSMGKEGGKITYVPSLVRNKDATLTTLQMAGKLFMKGQVLDFLAINSPKTDEKTPLLVTGLPRYPWKHDTKYWYENRISQMHRHKKFARSDVIGTLAEYSNELEPTWRNIIRTEDLPWLRDHKMQSLTTFPFAGFIAMATEAASQRATTRSVQFDKFVLREVRVSRPLLLDDGSEYEVTISLRAYTEGTRSYSDLWDEFRISSWDTNKGWTEHCRGLVGVRSALNSNTFLGESIADATKLASELKLNEIVHSCNIAISSDLFYQQLTDAGAVYGPTFRTVDECHTSDNAAVGTICVSDTAAVMPFRHEAVQSIHPALLDQVFQMVFPMLGAGRDGLKHLYMPSQISEFSMNKNVPRTVGEKLRVIATGSPDLDNPNPVDFRILAFHPYDSTEPVISFDGLTMSPIRDNGSSMSGSIPRETCYRLRWEPAEIDKLTNSHCSPHEVNGFSDADETSLHSSVDRVDSPITGAGPEVMIICETSESFPLASALKEALGSWCSVSPSLTSLGEANVDDRACIVLSELEKPILAEASPQSFDAVKSVFSASTGVLWVTRGAYKSASNPNGNMALGLTRTIRSETASKAATIDLAADSKLDVAGQAGLIADALKDSIFSEAAEPDMEYSEEDGKLMKARVVEDEEMNVFLHHETGKAGPYLQAFAQNDRRLKLAIENYGALDTLYFTDDPPTQIGMNEIEIKVMATGMNFKDVVIAMGQLPSPYLGIECSGIVSCTGSNVTGLRVGDRVSAMPEGAYSTFARCPATSAAKIPSEMSFEVAASIPVVYCTAYYGLIDLGRLCESDRILIHAAAGGVGQASIQIAKMIGAEIFATVGSLDKKQFIMEQYGIPEDHIFHSRNTSFGPAIRAATNGQGVDVVINSLAGDFLRETWDCLGHFGRFIEIGKRDITSNTRLEMAKFNYNATFSSVDLTVVAKERPRLMKKLMDSVMNLMSVGRVKPVAPITVHGIADIESAFRSLQSGKTLGKLIITPKEGEQVKVTTDTNKPLLRSDSTYLLIGGTGGLGRSMCQWMVHKGARTIILLSRSAKAGGKVGELIEYLAQQGAKAVLTACDIANPEQVDAVVKDAAKTLPPIRGIIHGAMVLRDQLFEKMNFDDYQAVVKSKVAGAWNIHNSLKNHDLDFFITLSSAAGLVGNRGQAAYAAANTFLNGFVQYRVRQGLPATSIDLTAIQGVGYLADNAERNAEVLSNLGGETLDETEVLALLAAAISGVMSRSCNNHCLTGLKLNPESPLPFYASDAKFTYLRRAVEAALQGSAGTKAAVSVSQAVKQAQSKDEALQVITEGLVNKLSSVLMIPAEDMDVAREITAYGLDSLNAIELRNWITKELQANLQVLELLTSGSLSNLAEVILKKMKNVTFA